MSTVPMSGHAVYDIYTMLQYKTGMYSEDVNFNGLLKYLFVPICINYLSYFKACSIQPLYHMEALVTYKYILEA